jgi:hypothetical protein
VADSHFYIGGEETQLFIVCLSANGEPGDLIELHPGRLSAGAAEKDDIFLNLVGVAPSHINFVFLDGHITVLSANHEVRLGGVVQKVFPFEWEPLHVISLGSAHLTYGTSQGPWPMVPEMQEQLVEEVVELEEEQYVPPPKRTVKEHAVISARRGAIVVTTAVVVVVLGLATNFLFGSRDIVSPNERSIESAHQDISRLLQSDRQHLSTVKLEKRIDGALSITGFIDDPKSYALLADAIRNESIKTRGNVRFDALSKEKLSEQIKDLIGNYPLKFNLTLSGNDIYTEITGIKTADLDLANLKNQLERINDRVDPRVFHYTITTIDPIELTKTINAKLASSPLTRNIKFDIKSKSATIKGVIAAAAEEKTMPLIRSMVAKEMTSFPVVVDIAIDPKVNFKVSSIVTGAQMAVANLTFRGKTESRSVGEDVFGQGELLEIRKDGVIVGSRSRELFVPVTYDQ